jgi:type IV pilus assembly protein PilF
VSAVRKSIQAALLCVIGAGLLGCGTSGTPSGNNREELKTASDTTTADKRAGIWLQLAIGYYQNGQYDTALDEIKKAIAASPDMADLYGMRGLIYSAMGNQVPLADENFQRALRLAPNDPETSNNYGSFLCQNGRMEQGMPYFDAALRNPYYQSPLTALVNAGNCSIKLKKLDQAERYLLDAQRRDEDKPAVNINLARLYVARSDFARAGVYFNRARSASRIESMPADVLWLGIRIEKKLGDTAAQSAMATQLRRRYAGSNEYAAYKRGAFDE